MIRRDFPAAYLVEVLLRPQEPMPELSRTELEKLVGKIIACDGTEAEIARMVIVSSSPASGGKFFQRA